MGTHEMSLWEQFVFSVKLFIDSPKAWLLHMQINHNTRLKALSEQAFDDDLFENTESINDFSFLQGPRFPLNTSIDAHDSTQILTFTHTLPPPRHTECVVMAKAGRIVYQRSQETELVPFNNATSDPRPTAS